jgi:hypothetical protein
MRVAALPVYIAQLYNDTHYIALRPLTPFFAKEQNDPLTTRTPIIDDHED